MASNELVGNLSTDKLPQFMHEKQLKPNVLPKLVARLEKLFKQLISS